MLPGSAVGIPCAAVPVRHWGLWLPWGPRLGDHRHPTLPSSRAATAAWAGFAPADLRGNREHPEQLQYQCERSPHAHTELWQGFVIYQEPNHGSNPVSSDEVSM